MLSVRHLSYRVASRLLLDDISLDFAPGKLHLILGPNGAGKSTLVKALSHQLVPQSGTIHYGGQQAHAYSTRQLAQVRAVLSQHIDLSFPLSVYEVVMMGRSPHFQHQPQAADLLSCEQSMRYFDVWDLRERGYMSLSGGEKQRVHFARVLAQLGYPSFVGPAYLLLDEPLTFLDVRYQFDFMHKVVTLLQHPQLVVVGVVHDLNLASKFADQVVLLHQGKVVAHGPKHEVLTKENIETVYQLSPTVQWVDGNPYFLFG